MSQGDGLSRLSNPLATSEQLLNSSSRLDGIPADLEASVRYAGAQLSQAAGILLNLPQEIVAQAVVFFTRFLSGPEGGSLRQYGAKDVSATCIYMAAKLSAYPQSARSILNVYAYLSSEASNLSSGRPVSKDPQPDVFHLTEGTYLAQRVTLFKTEAKILSILGFETHVALPYSIAINYLQALDVFNHPSASQLAKRVFAHLNGALLSPQFLYLTHQPPALAVAAIYLAARELEIKLVSDEWWEIFDVDREELGFLVVAMKSLEGFVKRETEIWRRKAIPLTVEDLDMEIDDQRLLNNQT